jgi:hypothetical protein
MKWVKDSIVEDLTKIIAYDSNIEIEVEDKWNPAESYCSEISLIIKNMKNYPYGNGLTVCGFVDDGNISDSYNPVEDILLVEVKDSYGNGLSKRADKRVRELYFKVVDYFNQFDVEIVDDLHDYF